MTVVSEVLEVDRWIYATLSADATIISEVADRIHDHPAPKESRPLITFQYIGGSDVIVTGGHRVMTRGRWIVRAIVDGSSHGPAEPIAIRIDELLNDATGSTAQGTILSSVRDTPFRLSEVDGELNYRHLGGIYTIRSQAT